MTTRDLKIHGFYIGVILTSCLIFQTVYDWSKIPNVAELISFAVGLVSLVLAVIAIIQNLVSGPSMSASISAINSSALSVTDATDKLDRSAQAVISRLETLDSIPKGLDDIQQAVVKLSSLQAANEPSHATPHANEETTRSPVDIPTQVGTVGANATLYMLARAIESKKEFNLSQAVGPFPNVAEYMSAYLFALKDLNSISFDYENGQYKNISAIGKFDSRDAIFRTVNSKEAYVRARKKSIDAYYEKIEALSTPAAPPPTQPPESTPPNTGPKTTTPPPEPAATS